MPKAAVVVELHFQSNLFMPAILPPFDASQNYFATFGLSEKLLTDPGELQKIFYVKSRNYHPDRFVSASNEQKKLSALWSAQLNEAYNTLKDFHQSINYLLTLKNIPGTEKNQMPVELSEAYFEAQESGNTIALEKQIDEKLNQNESELKALAAQWDQTQKIDILRQIREKFDFYRYISSMKRNLAGIHSHD